ncbi:MAG: L-amino acid N-acyltransferase YncA [Cryomorphaceae bacterium]|jgi:L-amino acid N-acyltransferase YncA
MIRLATELDSTEIVKIYNFYVLNTTVTFEEYLLEPDEMADRIASTLKDNLPWLVAEQDGQIIGYAYASKWKGRCAYKHSVESTVYLSDGIVSKGWGSKLYQELLKALTDKNFHVAIGGISLPNAKSVGLHEKFGFEKVGHFREVGYKFDKWVDVGYWQINLESNERITKK